MRRGGAGRGVFIELEEGIDGLVYISDRHRTKKVKHPSAETKKYLKVVAIFPASPNRRQMERATQDNPWDKSWAEDFAEGTVHNERFFG